MNKFFNTKDTSTKGLGSNYLVNEQIKATKIQVIGKEGENFGTISRLEALNLAREAESDLVQVGEKEGVIIAKIMDFGKFLYAKKKQLSVSKKKQKVVKIKEVKLRPNIGDQDYNTKMNQAATFLQDGKKVKFTLQLKGREMIMVNEIGRKIFERINNDLNARNIGTLIEEKEQRAGALWSKIYYIK